MKKEFNLLRIRILLCSVLAILLLSPTILNAQRTDAFISNYDEYEDNFRDIASYTWTFGNDPFGEKPVPIGSGLLIMVATGAGYVIVRRKRSLRNSALLMLALTLVLSLTQCKKKSVIATSNNGNKIHITLNVGHGGRHEIIPNEEGYVPVRYMIGDVIYVGNGSTYIGTLTCTVDSDENGKNASFEGEIIKPNVDDALYFYFVGGLTPSVSLEAGATAAFTVDISNQSSRLPVLSYAVAVYNGESSFSCTLHNQCALVEFKLNTATGWPVKISNMYSVAEIDFANPGIRPTGEVDAITLYPLHQWYQENYKNKWAILLPGIERSSIARVTTNMADNNETYCYFDYDGVRALNNCDYIYGDNAIFINNNAAPTNKNLFVVSDNGNVVQFAPGNLQYNASSTPHWRFATNQYDIIGKGGEGGIKYGNVSNSDNRNIGNNDYEGWIDLFGWGTWGGGNNPCLHTKTASDYAWTNDFQGTIDGYSNWRVLTDKEWRKLSSYYGGRLANIGKVKVNGINGAIICPENSGIDCSSWTSWTVIDDKWDEYEQKGAVFLPNSCYREDQNVKYRSSEGRYWSSTPSSSYNNCACFARFLSGSNVLSFHVALYYEGNPVRLVR